MCFLFGSVSERKVYELSFLKRFFLDLKYVHEIRAYVPGFETGFLVEGSIGDVSFFPMYFGNNKVVSHG